MKAYDALIGEWVYEGEVQEEVPEGPQKGTPFVVKASWKWILDKNVIEEQWQSTMEDRTIAGGKNKERDFFTWTVTEDGKKTEYTFRRVKK